MRTALVILTIPTLAVAGLAGCTLRPAGDPVSQERDIEAVTAVVLESAGDLRISEGEPSLVIHAGSRVIESLTSDVRGDQLVLGTDRRLPFGPGEVRYELTLPSLGSVRVSGAGDVDGSVSGDTLELEIDGAGDVAFDGIDASSVSVSIDGSGEVELSGDADELDIRVSGAGSVDAAALTGARVEIDIDGAGDAEVHATDALDVRVSGAGDVTYSGDPEVTREIDGIGDVRPS